MNNVHCILQQVFRSVQKPKLIFKIHYLAQSEIQIFPSFTLTDVILQYLNTQSSTPSSFLHYMFLLLAFALFLVKYSIKIF